MFISLDLPESKKIKKYLYNLMKKLKLNFNINNFFLLYKEIYFLIEEN